MSATNTTVTRNLKDLESPTGNVYEAVAVIAKRSNQIATKIKEELNTKLAEFATPADSLEEVYENRLTNSSRAKSTTATTPRPKRANKP